MAELYLPHITDHQRLDHGHWMLQDCVLWLPMCDGGGGTCHDWSGRGNNGTLTNMDPATDWVVGEYGRSLDFDGSNDHVDLGNVGLSVTSGASYSVTVAFRIYIPSGLATGCNVYTQASGAVTDSGMLGYRSTTHSSHGLGIRVWPGTGAGGGLWKTLVPLSAITEDSWCHVAAVFTPGGGCTGFHNGVQYNTVTTDFDFAGAAMRIGEAYLAVNDPHLTGKISDFRIYKTALSEAQIREIHSAPWQAVNYQRRVNYSIPAAGNFVDNTRIYMQFMRGGSL